MQNLKERIWKICALQTGVQFNKGPNHYFHTYIKLCHIKCSKNQH